MADAGNGLVVQLRPVDGDEDADLLDQAALLRRELLELDLEDVRTLTPGESPVGAKGVADLAGWLAVQVGSVETVRAVIELLRGWAGRRSRDVEVTMDADTLKLNGITAAEQEHIIDAWLARHATSS
jgi:hypothetical protein